jgi:hypothetical protein
MAGCSLLGLLVVMGLPAGATGRAPQAGPGGSSQPR